MQIVALPNHPLPHVHPRIKVGAGLAIVRGHVVAKGIRATDCFCVGTNGTDADELQSGVDDLCNLSYRQAEKNVIRSDVHMDTYAEI